MRWPGPPRLPAPTDAADAALLQRAHGEALGLFLRQWRSAMTALVVLTIAVFVTALDQSGTARWDVWFVLTLANTLAQSLVARAMERAPTPATAARRWTPWLLSSIVMNGVLWGAVPLLALATSVSAMLLACLLNTMLLFCVSNAHGTPAMQRSATWSLAAVTCIAPLAAGQAHVAAGFALLAALINFHGWRVRAALLAAMLERYGAQRLAAELQAQQAQLVENQQLLVQHQQQLMALERERTLLLERQRLMRDMHDGIGSTLVSSLAAVERGTLPAHALGSILRDCLDELRTVIDSLDPADHDLAAMLATLRRRLERRLDSTGVRLRWQVGDLPALPWLGAPETLHVMRIVQEVLANVVKHAEARNVWLAACAVQGGVQITLSDDGRGFNHGSAPTGRGLRSLQSRADALGGTLTVDTSPGGGTRVTLSLQLQRQPPGCAVQTLVGISRAPTLRR